MYSEDFKTNFFDLLKKFHGNVSAAVDAVNKDVGDLKLSRQTVYNWIDADPKFAEIMKDIQERRLDNAETMLDKLVAEANPQMIMYLLNNKGRSRGYGQHKVAIEHSGNIASEKVDTSKLSFEEKQGLLESLEKLTEDESNEKQGQ